MVDLYDDQTRHAVEIMGVTAQVLTQTAYQVPGTGTSNELRMLDVQAPLSTPFVRCIKPPENLK